MLVAGSPQELFATTTADAPDIYDASLSGVRGDGGEYTAELNEAVAIAAQYGIPLRLPSGSFSIATDTTIDFTGVPEVIGHGTTIDCSKCTALDVFAVNGSRTLIRSRVSFRVGASALDVSGLDLELERGDTIIVTSVEPHPNRARDMYFKGSRTYVDSIAEGEIRFYPQIDFDYAGTAYVWKVEERQFRFSGITMLGNPHRSQTGLRLRMADADVDADFRYFARGAVRFEASQGTYTGSIRYPFLAGANSYGVVVSDLSEVSVTGAFITGTRHAVTVGGGTMFASDSGGRPISEDVRIHGRAAYPSSLTVVGGRYGSSRTSSRYADGDPSLEIGAIDAHGIAKSLNVTGAVIYGGLNIAAIESAVVSGNTIYHHNFPALHVADSVNPDWGSVVFTNNVSIFIGAPDPNASPPAPLRLFTVPSNARGRNLEISGNLFRSQMPPQHDQLIGLLRNFRHLRVSGNRFDFAQPTARPDLFLSAGALDTLDISNNELNGVRVTVFPQGGRATARLMQNAVRSCAGAGIQSDYYSVDLAARFAATIVRDNIVEQCARPIDINADLTRDLIVDGNVELAAPPG